MINSYCQLAFSILYPCTLNLDYGLKRSEKDFSNALSSLLVSTIYMHALFSYHKRSVGSFEIKQLGGLSRIKVKMAIPDFHLELL